MYSKYEEMKVVQQTISNYVDNQKYWYGKVLKKLNECSNSAPDISDKSKIVSISGLVDSLQELHSDYMAGKRVLEELQKAIMCYEQAYSLGQDEIAKMRAKEGNGMFFRLRTQDDDYNRIWDEISFDLLSKDDKNVEGVERMGADTIVEQLENRYQNGALSKNQLIFYTMACYSIEKQLKAGEHNSVKK